LKASKGKIIHERNQLENKIKSKLKKEMEKLFLPNSELKMQHKKLSQENKRLIKFTSNIDEEEEEFISANIELKEKRLELYQENIILKEELVEYDKLCDERTTVTGLRDNSSAYFCPISLDLIKEPVVAPTGIVYDKATILKWLEWNSTCPMTKIRIKAGQLYPLHALK